MRVLLLSRYDRLGASSRVRFLQYSRFLSASGIQVDIRPLFSDDYVRRLYNHRPVLFRALVDYFQRLNTLAVTGKYDLVWLEKELFPFLPAIGERLLTLLNVPYVVDYDDAIFHRYDQHSSPAVRILLGRKIDVVMRNAALVIVGNEYLANRAHAAGANRVAVVPTVIDIDKFNFESAVRSDALTVGWIGSPLTSKYLKPLEPVFSSLLDSFVRPLRFVAVGASLETESSRPFEIVKWAEEDEVQTIKSFDIGIMPLEDSDWEKGKCGYKLIQYMACSLPTVASPVGVNREIVKHGFTGYLASNPAEWSDAIRRLLSDDKSRIEMGNRGRISVENWYTVQVQAPRLIELLRSAAE